MTAPDPKVAELVARMTWDRFAMSHNIEFADDANRSEYQRFASDVLAALALAPSPGVQPGGERERLARIIDPAAFDQLIPIWRQVDRQADAHRAADRVLAALAQPTEPREIDNGR